MRKIQTGDSGVKKREGKAVSTADRSPSSNRRKGRRTKKKTGQKVSTSLSKKHKRRDKEGSHESFKEGPKGQKPGDGTVAGADRSQSTKRSKKGACARKKRDKANPPERKVWNQRRVDQWVGNQTGIKLLRWRKRWSKGEKNASQVGGVLVACGLRLQFGGVR